MNQIRLRKLRDSDGYGPWLVVSQALKTAPICCWTRWRTLRQDIGKILEQMSATASLLVKMHQMRLYMAWKAEILQAVCTHSGARMEHQRRISGLIDKGLEEQFQEKFGLSKGAQC